ncbi:uncharacterized protein BDR25DRAFT_52197 [Lindgomyces ingoldianus]|uniref:Uncharacterized protein n=1 Tax=Lindgomyces ingoldianus TaxID=673940 RepID=A0ACB6QNU9_9PLEO|nr:uncharacterized protein BDR25DRAFT_52197 [Lindgomyces ingoldianus]KAF2468694.1 hypothetical protein BDR25DRAFT_52197 [Lindgomyces ingoldianus]
MSMIIQNVLMQHHLCPRPSCRRKLAFSSTTNGSAIVCSGCGLTCYLRKMPETADDVTVLESEEVRVEQQQIDEDYQIFGERPIPSDTMKIDEDIFDIQSMAPRESIKTEEPLAESMLPTLSAWGQVELDALLSGRNITKIEPQNTEDERVNPTPLDAWLDQVSVLSASEMGTPTAGHGTIHNGDSETNALECFRHIHIDRAYDKCSVASDEPQNARNLREVSFNARIFYRNIRDKYPQMPEYLVKRPCESF